jgi:gliding motility-associated-like protein
MNNFDEIVKQQLEQFEVPYNDAHWAEMDEKLNSIRTTKIKKNIFSAAGGVAVIAISSFYIFPLINDNPTIEKSNYVAKDNTTEYVVNDNKPNTKISESIISDKKVNNEVVLIEDEVIEELQPEILIEENPIENKVVEKNIKEEEIIPITIEPKSNSLNAEFIVYNNRVCLNEEVSFEAVEKNLPVSYAWDFGDGTTSNKVNPKHIYKESGKYDVTLTLINRKTGNEVKHTEINSTVILPLPKTDFSYAEISLTKDDNKLKYPYTEFSSKDIERTNSHVWNFGNGATSSAQNPKIIFDKKGEFQVMLTVKNSYGCYNTLSKNVSIKQDVDLFAPNAFTPNNNGDNESFIPKALLGWDVLFEMTIINKASKVIYKTTDKNEPWNGKLNNTGALLSEGLYFWQVITYDAEGISHRHHGQVHLIK